MKIAQINLQSDWGGAEKHVLLLAEGLRDRGNKVLLCCHPRGCLRNAAINTHVPAVPVTAFTQIDLSAALRLAVRLRRFRPEILHLHTPKDYVCGMLAARWLKPCKVVLTRHMLLPLKPIMRSLYCRADAIITLCRAVYESLKRQQIPSERLRPIRSGIDITEFNTALANETGRRLRASWRISSEEVAIGIIGRLVRGKGHAALLQTFARLTQTYPATKLIIIGEGPERVRLESLSQQAHIAQRVIFAGFCGDIPATMAALDVSVLASTSELLPLSVMEAMASGRAVVATEVGGVPELIQDGITGFLVPPDDPEAMACALGRLIAYPGLRIAQGRAGRLRAEQEFALPCMIQDIEQIYRSLSRISF